MSNNMENNINCINSRLTPLRETLAGLSLKSVSAQSQKQLSSSFSVFDDESRDSGFGSPGSPLAFNGSFLTATSISMVTHRGPRKALFSSKRVRDEVEEVDYSCVHKRAKSFEHENDSVQARQSDGQCLVAPPLSSPHNMPVPRLVSDHVITPPTQPCNNVKTAVDRFEQEEELIGDGSRKHVLPTIQGKKPDLKYISPSTVYHLLTGNYNDVISGFQIIDCRYPYEFAGGHIEGATNIYTESEIKTLLTSRRTESTGRQILILHCEFSSERGPKMLRYLRSADRKQNSDVYPALCYPEVYILNGGYKAFYEENMEMCQPMKYVPMLHKSHSDDLRHFRSRSKSWTAGEVQTKSRRHRFESFCSN